MTDREVLDAVFVELVDQRTFDDELEEVVDLLHEPGLWLPLPGATPEEEERFNRREKRTAPIREPRRRDRCGGLQPKRNDPDGPARRQRASSTILAGARCGTSAVAAPRTQTAVIDRNA